MFCYASPFIYKQTYARHNVITPPPLITQVRTLQSQTTFSRRVPLALTTTIYYYVGGSFNPTMHTTMSPPPEFEGFPSLSAARVVVLRQHMAHHYDSPL